MSRFVVPWRTATLLLLSFLILISFSVVHAQQATSHKTYRLVRVKIPPDSPHRIGKEPGDAPWPYVVIFKNGKELGKSSSAPQRGWEVEYPDEDRNRWQITDEESTSYTLQVLNDYHWPITNMIFTRNPLIFSKTGLKAADFAAPIKEELGSDNSPKNAISVEFAEVQTETPK